MKARYADIQDIAQDEIGNWFSFCETPGDVRFLTRDLVNMVEWWAEYQTSKIAEEGREHGRGGDS